MPFCEGYERLETHDKAVYIGELAHVAMFDQQAFLQLCQIINDARERGVLDRVKFGSDVYKNEKPNS